MVDIIQTNLDQIKYIVPDPIVEVADSIYGPYFPILELRVDNLRMAVAPDIDEASLSFVHGRWQKYESLSSDLVNPLQLNEKFVRITLPCQVTGTDDGFEWYGVIEATQRFPDGTDPVRDPSELHAGNLKITAYGLLRLLEKSFVNQTIIQTEGSALTLRINRGLTFNVHEPDTGKQQAGNRSTLTIGTGGPYIFSEKPVRKTRWTASQAVDYLLWFFAPPLDHGAFRLRWKLENNVNLNWFDINTRTDSRSVKSLLDELINRHRGVGYYTQFDVDTATVTIRTFSFTDDDITLPSGQVLNLNPNQKDLQFEEASDVSEAEIRTEVTTSYHRVVARGAFKTSMFTLQLDSDSVDPTYDLEPAWFSEDRLSYWAGASGEPGYDALELNEKYKRNSEWRRKDELSAVYSRFTFRPDHPRCVGDPANLVRPLAPEDACYWISPLEIQSSLRPISGPDNGVDQWPEDETFWMKGLQFRSVLPLKDQYDYERTNIADETWDTGFTGTVEPKYLKPFAFIGTGKTAEDLEFWGQMDLLNEAKHHEEKGRGWSVDLEMGNLGPVIDFKVRGKPQHFINTEGFKISNPAETDPTEDPTRENGLDYVPNVLGGVFSANTMCTVSVQLDSRVEESFELFATQVFLGRQKRTLTLDFPDKRRDYVVPKTVVKIENGLLIQTDSGGFVQDDRTFLKDIARAAAEWYKPRRVIDLSIRQLRKYIDLGDLVVLVGNDTDLDRINTPVTSIEFDFLNVETTIVTSYGHLDFSP